MPSKSHRTTSLVISLLGAVFNLALATQVLSLWKSIKWEPESEWEGAVDVWKTHGVKLVWGLVAAYFAAAATACLVGFLGIIKHVPSYVRFYRDYSIADFSFCTFFTCLCTYAAFLTPVRASVCEQLSRQPELMRDMVEMGLSLENCELWFERAVMASLALMVVVIVLRLHFLIAVSNYYCYLVRHPRTGLPTHASTHSHTRAPSLQRIYLLPHSRDAAADECSLPPSPCSPDDIVVYAPLPLSALSPKAARDIRSSATEAWISRSETEPSLSSSSSSHNNKHRHHRHQASISSLSSSPGSGAGRIRLPVGPDEGLLPAGYHRVYGVKA